MTALKLLRGTVSYYHLVIQLPASFFDQVTVSFVVSSARSRSPLSPYLTPLQVIAVVHHNHTHYQ